MDLSGQPIIPELNDEASTIRLSHLIRRRQHELDRIVRILKANFVSERPRAPRCGHIAAIYLVGKYADISMIDREDGRHSTYEVWAVVSHPEFRGLDKVGVRHAILSIGNSVGGVAWNYLPSMRKILLARCVKTRWSATNSKAQSCYMAN